MTSPKLNPACESLLRDCAEQLNLSLDETLARAVARLHVALYQSDADIADIDYSQSAESLTGPDVEVISCLFEIAGAQAAKWCEP